MTLLKRSPFLKAFLRASGRGHLPWVIMSVCNNYQRESWHVQRHRFVPIFGMNPRQGMTFRADSTQPLLSTPAHAKYFLRISLACLILAYSGEAHFPS